MNNADFNISHVIVNTLYSTYQTALTMFAHRKYPTDLADITQSIKRISR